MVANFSSLSPIDEKTVWEGGESLQMEIDETMIRASQAAGIWRNQEIKKRLKKYLRRLINFCDIFNLALQPLQPEL